MLGAKFRETCTSLRETLPRTLCQSFTGDAASFRASLKLRRRSTRVCAQYAASCEVLSDSFHPVLTCVAMRGGETRNGHADTVYQGYF
jgi:hypothetical protein